MGHPSKRCSERRSYSFAPAARNSAGDDVRDTGAWDDGECQGGNKECQGRNHELGS